MLKKYYCVCYTYYAYSLQAKPRGNFGFLTKNAGFPSQGAFRIPMSPAMGIPGHSELGIPTSDLRGFLTKAPVCSTLYIREIIQYTANRNTATCG